MSQDCLEFFSPEELRESRPSAALPGQRIFFMGTPEFSCPALRALREGGWTLVGAATQPDRPVGRKMRLSPPPVKILAEALAVPVYQWPTLRASTAATDVLEKLAPDLIVTAAYGLILPAEILSLPKLGCLNLHPSLLPRFRGAAPIAASILEGGEETGTSIYKMGPALDDGPILARCRMPLPAKIREGELSERLAELSAELLLRLLPSYLAGEIRGLPQDEGQATYIKKLRREDGCLDFKEPAARLERQIRAFDPWPGSFAFLNGGRYKFLDAVVGESLKDAPGTLRKIGKELRIACGEGSLIPLRWQNPSGKTVEVAEVAHNFTDGSRFSSGKEAE